MLEAMKMLDDYSDNIFKKINSSKLYMFHGEKIRHIEKMLKTGHRKIQH